MRISDSNLIEVYVNDGVHEATRYAIEIARKHQLLISFDPNLREPLWDSLELLRQKYDIPLAFLTMGKEGSRVYYQKH